MNKKINNNIDKELLEKINEINEIIKNADAILIGAGSGLSASAGLEYSGKRFEKYFEDFIKEYNLTDMYSAGFYPYGTDEKYWGYWSNHIFQNRYNFGENETYKNLLNLVKNKDYFILTTNVDHQFQKNGFDKKRLFYTQGDYGLFQCSVPCNNNNYDNEEIIYKMIKEQKNLEIPSKLIPICSKCGAKMVPNLRVDSKFVQDEGWYNAHENYKNFLLKHEHSKIVFLELGVGANTPGIIKYPFWNMVKSLPKSKYICINKNEAIVPRDIEKSSILVEFDISYILEMLQ